MLRHLSRSLALLLASGCYTQQLDNRPCGPSGECLPGYQCLDQVCVAGNPPDAGGGAGVDAGLQVQLQVLPATGRMTGSTLEVEVFVGDPVASVTMSGGPWTVTTSVSAP